MTNNHLGIIQYINVHNIYYPIRQTHLLLREIKNISYISTLSTLMPQSWVASSRTVWELERNYFNNEDWESFDPSRRVSALHWDSVMYNLGNKNFTPTFTSLMESCELWEIKNTNIDFTCIDPAILSLSLRISCRFLVPRMFLNVVWARSLNKTFQLKNKKEILTLFNF